MTELSTNEETVVCSLCGEIKPITRYPIRTDHIRLIRRKECMDCINKRVRKKWRELRAEIFNHYGWECRCCGETIKEFLSLDHIENDGYLDKNPNGDKKSGKELYLLVKKQGFPSKYQTLCMNCNWGKKVGGGVCPHQRIKSTLLSGKKEEYVKS